jgi:hypothetical integral membrane protein (TIGR02206 family)
LTAASGALLAMVVRRSGDARVGRGIRFGLAALLIGLTVLFLVRAAGSGTLHWYDFVPLQLCDLAVFLAAYALISLSPRAFELVYFWGLAGTLIAMLTPDVVAGFPSWEFVFFFMLHGGVVVAAIVLTFGFGLRPQKGAVVRIFAITNVYAAFIGVVNVATGSNFLYLCAKPRTASLLDWFGPWPFYILGGEALALVFFWVLDLPFRLRYSQASQTKEPAS